MNRQERRKFRQSKKWRNFRSKVKKYYYGIDVITLKPLKRIWNCHHMDQYHYDDLSDMSKFRPLNEDTHEMLHWLFDIYKKDLDVLKRVESILEDMYYYYKTGGV